MRYTGSNNHPRGNSLAVQPFSVAQPGFNGMSECMTEIEKGSNTFLALICCNYRSLVLAGDPDSVRKCIGVTSNKLVHIAFKPLKKYPVSDQAVLDDFSETCSKLAFGQCFKRIGICDDYARLIKRTDHVLAERVIDRGFAAYRRINLCQQSRRNLDERCATLKHRCSESNKVADHTTTERDQRSFAFRTPHQQGIENLVQRLPILVRFAIGQNDCVNSDLPSGQSCFECFKIKRRDYSVRDDDRFGLRKMCRDQIPLMEESGSDMDRITPMNKINMQRCL